MMPLPLVDMMAILNYCDIIICLLSLPSLNCQSPLLSALYDRQSYVGGATVSGSGCWWCWLCGLWEVVGCGVLFAKTNDLGRSEASARKSKSFENHKPRHSSIQFN